MHTALAIRGVQGSDEVCQKRLYPRYFALHTVLPLQRTPGYRLKSLLQREPEIKSRQISYFSTDGRYVCAHVQGPINGPSEGAKRPVPLQRDRGAPPGRPQPARSLVGAARASLRGQSRAAEISMQRSACEAAGRNCWAALWSADTAERATRTPLTPLHAPVLSAAAATAVRPP